MKTNKWLVVAVLAVLALGGAYGGLRYVENRVLSTVREALAGVEGASAGSVRFTLPDRKLAITDFAATLYKDTRFACAVTIQSAEAVLPWEIILSTSPEGSMLVAETLDIQGFEHVSQEDATKIAVGREHLRGVRTDLASLHKVLFEKTMDPAALAALEERSSLEWGEAEDAALTLPGTGEVRIDAMVIERQGGMRIGSARVKGLSASVVQEGKLEQTLEIASLTLENLDMPADARRMMRELPPDASPEQMQALVTAMFSGKTPLVGRLEVQDLKMDETIAPVRIRSLRVDWPSADPMRCTSELDGLTMPTAFVERESGLRLPNLPAVDLSVRTSVDGDANAINTRATYTLKDCCNLDLRFRMIPAASAAGAPVPLVPHAGMENAALADLECTLEDRNLMAYVLLNTEGPEATGDRLTALLPMLSMLLGMDGEVDKAKLDTLAAFIKQPGTLSLGFTPESPLPASQFPDMLFDPSAKLTLNHTPGAASAQDLVKKILAGAE